MNGQSKEKEFFEVYTDDKKNYNPTPKDLMFLVVMKYKIKPTHISGISVGDTIKCRDGLIRTVSKNNIHYLQDVGTTIFGDSYNLGNIPVDKVVFFNAR